MKVNDLIINDKYKISCSEINIDNKDESLEINVKTFEKECLLQFLWQVYLFYESRSLEIMSYISKEEFNKEFAKLQKVNEVIETFKKDLKECE
ncbi:hypothetical protein [Vagococcus fluvialis]|uniref:hypothetical protein n=1 Tax=Vagococcus fluvialis TaxID=2738 RepID=UPI0037B717BC